MVRVSCVGIVLSLAVMGCGSGNGLEGAQGGTGGGANAASAGAGAVAGATSTSAGAGAVAGVTTTSSGKAGSAAGETNATSPSGGVANTTSALAGAGGGGVASNGAAGTGGTASSGAAGTGGTASSSAAGGSSTPPGGLGCDKDLSGTWDLFASSNGTGLVRGTLVISKDGFSFSARSTNLVYSAQGTKSATWKYNGYDGPSTRVISVQNTPAPVDAGSLPLALGGQWILTSNSETCTLNIAAGKITGKCTGRDEDYNVGGDDWPFQLMDSPQNRVTYTIARTSAAASQFGDFGGTWSARSDLNSGQGCTFSLEKNVATSNCHANNSFDGNLRLTVGADCVASGVTPSGAEVSARRR